MTESLSEIDVFALGGESTLGVPTDQPALLDRNLESQVGDPQPGRVSPRVVTANRYWKPWRAAIRSRVPASKPF
jgi:hypothetical protein